MSNDPDSVTVDAMISISEGVPVYDMYTDACYTSLKFHGKSIREWTEEVRLPEYFEDMDPSEIEQFNSSYLSVIEIIMRNHSIARISMNYAKNHYTKAYMEEKKRIIDTYTSAGRKAPAAHVIEDNANINILEVYTAYNITVMFYEFWESQAEKIKLAGFRLNNLNHSKSKF